MMDAVVFDEHVGGRVYGRARTVKRQTGPSVTVWEPPAVSSIAGGQPGRGPTEVEVRFTPENGRTRIDLEPAGGIGSPMKPVTLTTTRAGTSCSVVTSIGCRANRRSVVRGGSMERACRLATPARRLGALHRPDHRCRVPLVPGRRPRRAAHLSTGILVLLLLVPFCRPRHRWRCPRRAGGLRGDRSRYMPSTWAGRVSRRGRHAPYTHSLLTPLDLCALAAVSRGTMRAIALGAALGVGAHLLDVVTASGEWRCSGRRRAGPRGSPTPPTSWCSS